MDREELIRISEQEVAELKKENTNLTIKVIKLLFNKLYRLEEEVHKGLKDNPHKVVTDYNNEILEVKNRILGNVTQLIKKIKD